MSNFVVSARKYRPSRFDDVVGQEHVTRTLKNALQNDKLAHAFLFCGPRGVGKTTCARILAKVLNCQNVTDDFEPCNECPSCQAFSRNSSFNITELDAASNNSVEHIRALIEQVRFQPQQGKYKVFIIDEVHMLSQQAFNAFLKTLEEPPPYAIFILATTEKHKIIPTILSRCQIFDFKRLQVPAMVSHLQEICEQEDIQADKDALHIIGQKADGALRDALSIFDRIASFSGKAIQYQDVINNLNVLDYDFYFKTVDAMLTEDVSSVLLLLDDVLRKGFDADIFINGLAEHLRNLLVCKDPATLQLLEVSDNLRERYRKQAQIAPQLFLLTALNIANDCDVEYKMARNKRLHVEMALIKMAYIHRAADPAAVAPQEKKNPGHEELSSEDSDAKEQEGEETEEHSPRGIVASRIPQPPPLPRDKGGEEQVTEGAEDEDTERQEEPEAETAEKTAAPPDKRQKEVSTATGRSSATESAANSTSKKKVSRHAMPQLNGGLDALLKEVKEEEKNKQSERVEVTLDRVKEFWKEYTQACEQDSVKTVMRLTRLSVDGHEITATVGSSLAENTLRQESRIMDFLREKFHTKSLVLAINVDQAQAPKTPKRKKVALSDMDKFKKMHEVNPLIKEMQERFDLRFDE